MVLTVQMEMEFLGAVECVVQPALVLCSGDCSN